MKSDASLEADVLMAQKQAQLLVTACQSIRKPDCQADWDYGVAMTLAGYHQLKRIFEDEGLLEKLRDPDSWSFVNMMRDK